MGWTVFPTYCRYWMWHKSQVIKKVIFEELHFKKCIPGGIAQSYILFVTAQTTLSLGGKFWLRFASDCICILCRQNEFLNPKLLRLLCNSLIQPHFDYACNSCYSLINQKMRNKLQAPQNKCVFLFKTQLRQYIGAKEFKKIKWLPTKEEVEQRIVPSRSTYNTRSHITLEIPLNKSNLGQNNTSLIGPSIWNKLSNSLKILNTSSYWKTNTLTIWDLHS